MEVKNKIENIILCDNVRNNNFDCDFKAYVLIRRWFVMIHIHEYYR